MKGVVLAGHMSIDLILELTNSESPENFFKAGILQKVENTNFYTGGAVLNTGLALNKLGVPIRTIGTIGNDEFGEILLSQINRYNPNVTEGIKVKSNESTPYTLVLNFPGHDRIFLYSPGTNDSFNESDLDFDGIETEQYRIFHLGYPPLMKQMYTNDGTALIEIFKKAKQHGFVTSLDMAFPPPGTDVDDVNWITILEHLLPYVDIFMPSYDEILTMLNYSQEITETLPNITHLREITSLFIKYGCSIVGIKLGNDGLYIRTSDKVNNVCENSPIQLNDWSNRELYSPCFKADVVGTTGSGDSTIAGFLAALLSGSNPVSAVEIAVGTGAMSVETVDGTGGIKSLEILCNRIESGWEKHEASPVFQNWENVNEYNIRLGELDSFKGDSK